MSQYQRDPITGVPIIGAPVEPQQPEVNAPGLTAACEIYDSEIIKIEGVLEAMRKRADGGGINFGLFDKEVQERFADIGFKVAINWYDTNVEGVLIPEITITDRIEKHEFDYDQQVHEVTEDILDLGEKGVIESGPILEQDHRGHQH